MTSLLIDAVATYRLTRLVTADTITERPRRAVVQWAFRRSGQGEIPVDDDVNETIVQALEVHRDRGERVPKLAELVTCRWCTGVWVAFGVAALRRLAPRAWSFVGEALAISSAAPLLAALEDD